jgi:hypothetical protein
MQSTSTSVNMPTVASAAPSGVCPVHPSWCRTPHDAPDPHEAEHFGSKTSVSAGGSEVLAVRLEQYPDDAPLAWVSGVVEGELDARGLARMIASVEAALPTLWRMQAELAAAELAAGSQS